MKLEFYGVVFLFVHSTFRCSECGVLWVRMRIGYGSLGVMDPGSNPVGFEGSGSGSTTMYGSFQRGQ